MAVIHYQSPLGTLVNLQTAATAGQLIPRKLYGVQDGAEYAIAQATSASTFAIVGRGAVPPDPALVSAIRAGTGDGYLAPSETWGAHAPVAVTLTALNMATFIHGTATISANTTVANPTNVKAGQSGWIRVNKDATNTLSFAAYWKPNGSIDVTDATYCTINYVAVSPIEIQFSISKPEA